MLVSKTKVTDQKCKVCIEEHGTDTTSLWHYVTTLELGSCPFDTIHTFKSKTSEALGALGLSLGLEEASLDNKPVSYRRFDVFHFNPKKADRTIYVVPSTEFQTLLPGLKDDFLEMDIDDDIKNMLIKAANRGTTLHSCSIAGTAARCELLLRTIPSVVCLCR